MDTSKLNRRYHLHRKLRRLKIRFSANLKTIYYPVNVDIDNKDIRELQTAYNYNIQLEIPIE
jgi:hypothetical protein